VCVCVCVCVQRREELRRRLLKKMEMKAEGKVEEKEVVSHWGAGATPHLHACMRDQPYQPADVAPSGSCA
jgi:hypothetical protein